MKDLLEYLVKAIVDQPDKVIVDESTDQAGFCVLSVSVGSSDMGKVIGKGGKIIKSLRDLVRILAVKQNRRVNVLLKED